MIDTQRRRNLHDHVQCAVGRGGDIIEDFLLASTYVLLL